MVSLLLRSMRLLSDPNRVRLLLLLDAEELSVAELQEILAKGQSQISTHLSQLKRTGLVEDRRTGKNIFYRAKESASHTKLLELLRSAAADIPEIESDGQALELVLAKRKDRMRQYFDSLAGRFGREYLPGRSWQGLAEALLNILPPMVIADLGAGEGTFSQLLAKRAKHVIAVDSSERMVEFGRKLAQKHNVTNLEYRLGDMQELPVEDCEVDLAFFSQSLHHAISPQRAVGEAWRVLRPQGQIVILDLVRHTFEEARDLYADVWLGFTELELRRFLEHVGFGAITTSIVHREAEAPYFETLLAVASKA
jgi:ubiquinone/menaquinone biosynthesis C-methylase UbiE/predicted transcriptional regulator